MAASKETPGRRISKLITELGALARTDKLDLFIGRLERIKSGKFEPKIRPIELYLDVVEYIRDSSKDSGIYESLYEKAEELYDELFIIGTQTPGFDEKAAIFREIVIDEEMLAQGYFDRALFASFRDKGNYLILVKTVMDKKYPHDVFSKIKKYALDVREYLLDDVAYLMHLMRVTERLASSAVNSSDAILEEELLRVRRSTGLYDIDPVRLGRVEKNVNEAAAAIERGREILLLLDRKCNSLEKLAEETERRAEETKHNAEMYLETKTDDAKNELAQAVKEYEEAQRKTVFLEKEIFLKQIFSDAETEMNRYKSMAASITATAAAELQSLNRDADRMIGRLDDAFRNDEKLNGMLNRSRRDEDLMAVIEKLSSLKGIDTEALAESLKPRPAAAVSAQEEAPVQMHSGNVTVSRPQRTIPAVNPLLDRSVPFKQRFELVMKEKERRMKEGELFHEMFDDVITAVMENVNPYLIGPSGCGKTYMVKQIGEILKLDCTDIGYINEEYDILGYVTATGEYNESNFYRLYKYGGIAFCDELDNGNSKATVKLNSFLSNQTDSYYHFPGGERVLRHGNFRVIAAGNTDGNGADVNYSTREKIEESVQQRMIPIYMDYDNRVEKEILKDHPDWFDFACAFREATSEWSRSCGIPAQGIFTTRDAFRIRQYLENGSYTEDKIMNYEFVQTKEPEYLGFLNERLVKKIKSSSGAIRLLQLFINRVNIIRSREKKDQCV